MEPDKSLLDNMSELLKHRGPDDLGLKCQGELGFAQRRLSIIDLSSAGHQPMSTDDGRYTIVFNGEIYNYKELVKEHLSDVVLRSKSDTEVLLHILARFGEEGLRLLKGMFALAFWDDKEEVLIMARDPFGKKPLYYSELNGGAVVFSSEVKSLLLHPEVSSERDDSDLAEFLLHEYVPSPATGWERIKQVPMGGVAVVSASGFKVSRWWVPEYLPKKSLTRKQALSQLDDLLGKAVERRMVADVPVGVLLSGGLDSTAVTWYMKQVVKSELHSFSVSFDEASFDEGGYARTAAKDLKTIHHDKKFGLEEFKSSLSELDALMDIPFADASILPTYFVCKLAREHVAVALDGDGSDELLMGYGTYQAESLASKMSWVPKEVWRIFYDIASQVPAETDYFTWDFKMKQFLKGMSYGRARRNQVWLGAFSDSEQKELLTKEQLVMSSEPFDAVDLLNKELSGLSEVDSLTHLNLVHYMHNGILVKLDRASMFMGLETRTPFLDVDLAEFLMVLPAEMKRDKGLLKELMRGRISDEIIDRKKHGFAMPIASWLKGPLYDWAKEVLAEEKIKEGGVFKVEVVKKLLEEHRRGLADHRKKIWTLLMWQKWNDRWVEG